MNKKTKKELTDLKENIKGLLESKQESNITKVRSALMKIKLISELNKLHLSNRLVDGDLFKHIKYIGNRWMISLTAFRSNPYPSLLYSGILNNEHFRENSDGKMFISYDFLLFLQRESKIPKLCSDKISKRKTYLMLDNNTGLTKIGKSIDPKKREKTLQSAKPTVSLYHVFKNDIETELHKKFAHKGFVENGSC